MEDFAACTGVVIAAGGIGLTAATGDPMWDSLASIGVGCLLGTVAVTLVRINQRFLLGRAIDAETEAGIRDILKKRKTIEAVYRCQSQWLGPTSFSFKAEVDFDGTFLAANLTERYNPRFVNALQLKNDEALNKELSLLLAW
jgi:zinc transporter 9